MPVLPPTEESTCASSVVGTWTRCMPRSVTPAAKPARSPTTPPPSATTASRRSIRAARSPSTTFARAAKLFDASPGGMVTTTCVDAGRGEALGEAPEMKSGDGLVGDDRDARARQAAGDLDAGEVDDAAADQDVVGALAEVDGDLGRRPRLGGGLAHCADARSADFAAEIVGKRGQDVVDHHVMGDVARLHVDVGLGVDRVALRDQPVDDRLGIGRLEERPVGAPLDPRQDQVAVGLEPDRDARSAGWRRASPAG